MKKHIRWSYNDKFFGPFTYAKDTYKSLAIVLGSGDGDEFPGCRLRMQAFGHTLIVALPSIIQPRKVKVFPSTWDAETIARLGRNWFWDCHEREYGFSYSGGGGIGNGGFLQIFLGRQTHDSGNEQRWSCFTPWNNWRHVRHSFYDLEGKLFHTDPVIKRGNRDRDFLQEMMDGRDSCPTRTFSFKDFDGEELTAKTRIEEHQWELGTGWFKWLSRFHKPIIQRSLDIEFSSETGREKGSWKGGTVGHSIEMLPGELHESAFKRYCAELEMKYREIYEA